MDEQILIIKKNGTGGILGYSNNLWQRNENARAEYRLATKEEIAKYFDIVEAPEEEVKDDVEATEEETTKKNKKAPAKDKSDSEGLATIDSQENT